MTTYLKYLRASVVFQEIPDEITLAIEITGCPNRCEGCHSPELREDIGTTLTEDILSNIISKHAPFITCVCFMGGDQNPIALYNAMFFVSSFFGLKTAVYSGKDSNSFLGHPNYIKLGAFIPSRGGLRTKGTNQRLFKRQAGNCYEYDDITYTFQEQGI